MLSPIYCIYYNIYSLYNKINIQIVTTKLLRMINLIIPVILLTSLKACEDLSYYKYFCKCYELWMYAQNREIWEEFEFGNIYHSCLVNMGKNTLCTIEHFKLYNAFVQYSKRFLLCLTVEIIAVTGEKWKSISKSMKIILWSRWSNTPFLVTLTTMLLVLIMHEVVFVMTES